MNLYRRLHREEAVAEIPPPLPSEKSLVRKSGQRDIVEEKRFSRAERHKARLASDKSEQFDCASFGVFARLQMPPPPLAQATSGTTLSARGIMGDLTTQRVSRLSMHVVGVDPDGGTCRRRLDMDDSQDAGALHKKQRYRREIRKHRYDQGKTDKTQRSWMRRKLCGFDRGPILKPSATTVASATSARGVLGVLRASQLPSASVERRSSKSS